MSGGVLLPREQTVFDIHAALIARHGGAPGVRDPGAVAAALARPSHLVAYGGAAPNDAPRLACAPAYSVARVRHPFVDGNKRVAFALLVTVLDVNGWRLDAAETEAAEAMIGVSSGTLDEDAFVAWVQSRIRRPVR